MQLNSVEVKLFLNGKQCHFVTLELEQAFNQHHTCEVIVDYEELDENGWMYNPIDILEKIGESLTVEMVHKQTGEKNVFFGIIRNVTLLGKHGQQNQILFQGISETLKLEGKPSMDSFVNKDIRSIVTETVQTSGNGAEIIINTKYKPTIDYISKWDETCFSFLNRLSYLYGEAFYSDNGLNIYFGLPMLNNYIPIMYDAEITSLRIEANLTASDFGRYMYFVDDNKEWVSETVKENPQTYGYQRTIAQKSNSFFRDISTRPSEQNLFSLQDLTEQINLEKKKDIAEMLVLKGTSQTCKIGIGRVIEVIYPKYMSVDTSAGEFLITEISHSVDQTGTYSNSFTAIRAALEQIPVKNICLPNVSSQRATVLDNADPRGIGRIRVQFQWQKELNKETNWIRVQTNNGGGTEKTLKNRGFVFIPEIGDEVMINFENNNPDKPYCSGSLFSVANGEGGGNNNSIKTISTRSGIEIRYNDNIGALQLKDPSGSSIELDGSGNIKLFAHHNINLIAGENLNLTVGRDMFVNVANNLEFSVAGIALMNAFQRMTINTNMLQQIVLGNFHSQASRTSIIADNDIKIESNEAFLSGLNKLFLHSDATATLNSKGIAEMKGAAKNSFDNVGLDYQVIRKELDAKVIVHFRPVHDWNGEFGFDWLRVADTDMVTGNLMYGDEIYEGNIGKYYSDPEFTTIETNSNKDTGIFQKTDPVMFADLKAVYEPHNVTWRSTGGNIAEYFVAWVSMFPNSSVMVRLLIEVDEEVDEIRFSSTNPCIKTSPEILGNYAVGKYEEFITISCEGEINDDASIVVQAFREDNNGEMRLKGTAGKVKIWKNNAERRKKLKLLFVNVIANPGNDLDIDMEIGNVKKYLGHSLIELDESLPNKMRLPVFQENDFAQFVDFSGEIKMGVNGKTLNTYLDEKLERQIKRQFSDRNIRREYESYVKVYLINEKGNFANFSRNFGNFAVVYKNNNGVTCSHEVYHVIGIAHTFANKEARGGALITYKIEMTDNIMDYSDQRRSTNRWQWGLANSNVSRVSR